MSRLAWYREAFDNLGFPSLLRLQVNKRFGSRLSRLTSKYLRHPVYARHGTSDFLVFNQVFVGREYRCVDNIEPPRLIVDCGANVGYTSAYFLSKFPTSTILAVEPDSGNFDLLLRNLSGYGDRFKAIKAAVWPFDEKLEFQASTMAEGAEWGRAVQRPLGRQSSQMIDTVSIPKLIELSGMDRISVLKIDIEGAERELFSAGVDEWLDRVDNIVIELHGEECARLFFHAIRDTQLAISTCGELTVGLAARKTEASN
ncbi:putative methyltransferase [Tuber magnatum]|uniref:Putative methyltransferase n=1 Tax=Tuber magnatum TaxID=42249 RepID=A0A317SBA9_9PEZI|nr:putative methyltransferase [Tuber magnatum]